jgi:phosphoenolpyruvate synthase/pyruvate phosphate dikinase
MKTTQFKSPALNNFDPNGYHFFGLWKQNLFSACFWAYCFDQELTNKLGIKSSEAGSLVLEHGNFFIKKSEIENIKKQIWDRINARDEHFFKNMVSVADTYFRKSVEYGKMLEGKQITAETFEEFIYQARLINYLWMLGAEQFSEAAQEKLAAVAAEEHFPAEHISKIIPKFDTPLNTQHKEVVSLKKRIGAKTFDEVMADKNLCIELQDHIRRFGWIEIANFAGEPLTTARLYEQIIHAKDELVEDEKYSGKISDNLAFHATCLSYCGYIRQAGAEYFFMLSEKALPMLKKITEHFGLTYGEFLLQRDNEILSALRGELDSAQLKDNARKRIEMSVALFADSKNTPQFIESLEDIELMKKLMLPQINTEHKELKGQVGNRGAYTGPARIIMNTFDFHKMQTGDVLISTMTTPDFVVLMHKAGAIVTDIGGMLCHAAIVSREINKPCVIGTKFATKIFKDGDMVEVDADKGVVKIIK